MIRRTAALALLISLPAVLAACSSSDRPQLDRFFALGTVVELTIMGEQASSAGAALRQVLDEADARWSVLDPGAELAELNAALRAGRSAAVSTALRADLLRARELAAASDGLFDPTLGELIATWGFQDGAALREAPPAADALSAWLERPASWRMLQLDGDEVSASDPLSLDLGGLAKGLAAEAAARRLAELGVSDAIINLGGDLVVLGDAGGRPWRIAVRDPRDGGVLLGLEVADGDAVFTSGDYERWFEHQGRRYHHLLDPRTARPAQGLRSVTVVHRDAALADAAATALFVAGPQAWRSLADQLGVDSVAVLTAAGELELTEAMRWRVIAGGAARAADAPR